MSSEATRAILESMPGEIDKIRAGLETDAGPVRLADLELELQTAEEWARRLRSTINRMKG